MILKDFVAIILGVILGNVIHAIFAIKKLEKYRKEIVKNRR